MQTVLLGSSGSAIVEFIIPEAGSYVMVDHHFANASQGAIGVIDAGGKPEDGIEHHNVPATATPTDPEAVQGKLDFESKCLACHSIGGGQIGRASWRERVCQYVQISVVAASLKKNTLLREK